MLNFPKALLTGVALCWCSIEPISLKEYGKQYYELEKRQDFAGAVKLLTAALSEHPLDARTHLRLAHSLMKTADCLKAFAAYERAYELDSRSEIIQRNLASGFGACARKIEKKDPQLVLGKLQWSAASLQNFRARFELAAFYVRVHDLEGFSQAFIELSSKSPPVSEDEQRLYTELLRQTLGSVRKGRQFSTEFIQNIAVTNNAAGFIVASYQIRSHNCPLALKIAETLTTPEKEIISAACLYMNNDSAKGEQLFTEVSALNPQNFETPEKIAKLMADIIRLDESYKSHPVFPVIQSFEKVAVDRYFAQNPADNSVTYLCPLEGEIRIGRGHGHLGNAKSYYAIDTGRRRGASFGLPIRAAADGKVVAVADGNPDQKEGQKYSDSPANAIKILHTDGNNSNYVHLKENSIRVKAGDTVKAGEIIGELGNSGYSGGPHLHFQVNNSSNWSIPVKFKNLVRSDGKTYADSAELIENGVYTCK